MAQQLEGLVRVVARGVQVGVLHPHEPRDGPPPVQVGLPLVPGRHRPQHAHPQEVDGAEAEAGDLHVGLVDRDAEPRGVPALVLEAPPDGGVDEPHPQGGLEAARIGAEVPARVTCMNQRVVSPSRRPESCSSCPVAMRVGLMAERR